MEVMILIKQEFLYLEYDRDANTDDCEIANKINEDIYELYKDHKYYKIIDYKFNILKSKNIDKELESYPIISILILVEYES